MFVNVMIGFIPVAATSYVEKDEQRTQGEGSVRPGGSSDVNYYSMEHGKGNTTSLCRQ